MMNLTRVSLLLQDSLQPYVFLFIFIMLHCLDYIGLSGCFQVNSHGQIFMHLCISPPQLVPMAHSVICWFQSKKWSIIYTKPLSPIPTRKALSAILWNTNRSYKDLDLHSKLNLRITPISAPNGSYRVEIGSVIYMIFT